MQDRIKIFVCQNCRRRALIATADKSPKMCWRCDGTMYEDDDREAWEEYVKRNKEYNKLVRNASYGA